MEKKLTPALGDCMAPTVKLGVLKGKVFILTWGRVKYYDTNGDCYRLIFLQCKHKSVFVNNSLTVILKPYTTICFIYDIFTHV